MVQSLKVNILLRNEFENNDLVLQSKCPSYEGLSGIVVMETLRSFQIITPDNKLLSMIHFTKNLF